MSNVVDFYFDYASPWSYLASEILERQLPGVPVAHKPIYLRGFPQFRTGVPHSPNRLQYEVKDLRRCSQHHGVEVVFNHAFPVNGIHALRAAIWTQTHAPALFPALHQQLFRAAWHDDVDMGDKARVLAVAAAAGVTPDLDDPAVKETLRAETDRAQQRGAFGVPSFFLGDELFFGHDRMDYLFRAWQARRQG